MENLFETWLVKPVLRSRLRRIMRGYRYLKSTGSLGKIAKVKSSLTTQPLKAQGSPSTFGHVAIDCSKEKIVRQYLLLRIGGVNLNRALLFSLGKMGGTVVFPLPGEWREAIASHGFRVHNTKCAILWWGYICALFLYGVAKYIKIAANGLFSILKTWPEPRRHAYFENLGLENLPKPSQETHRENLFSWYLHLRGGPAEVDEIRHGVSKAEQVLVDGVSVLPQEGPFPPKWSFHQLAAYCIHGFSAISGAALQAFRGEWWEAFLLNQSALLNQVHFLPKQYLAKEYLFHNSTWMYRPLWTYGAERRGAKIAFYFYSTNSQGFKTSAGYPILNYGWESMTWPNYLVWDECQEEFVRRAVGTSATIEIVGPIPFQCSRNPMPGIHAGALAIFDVTPHRDSHYQTLGQEIEFYTPNVSVPFLQDICDAAEKCSVAILWKRKRNVGRMAHPRYHHLGDRLAAKKNIMILDPKTSAAQVIEMCAAVISMPYTSTALIARELGKPTAYYDPHSSLQRDDRAAHGIKIIQGRQELGKWMEEHLSSTKTSNLAYA
jgi:polysaccharide biosynthesis PFTS motif protein